MFRRKNGKEKLWEGEIDKYGPENEPGMYKVQGSAPPGTLVTYENCGDLEPGGRYLEEE